MSTPGCMSPSAVNYNALATVDNSSCVYLEKLNGQCYAFQDVNPSLIVDQSWTLSFSLGKADYVFFHDYIPDYYFSARDQLYNLKDHKIYLNNKGPYGVYHDSAPRSFFLDMVFPADSEMILDSVQWITDVLNQGQVQPFSTFTHITVWDSQQCTGRLPLDQAFKDLQTSTRKTQGAWSFDTLRDMVTQLGLTFLRDLFNNFSVNTAALNLNKPWFDQALLQDNWFLVRLEFDNSTGEQIILHGADITADKSYR